MESIVARIDIARSVLVVCFRESLLQRLGTMIFEYATSNTSWAALKQKVLEAQNIFLSFALFD